MRRLVLALGLGALALVPLDASPADAPTVTRHVLPGGLRLIIRQDATAPVVAVSLQVAAGSRFETPASSGISNFVQRVMVRGTAARSPQQIVEAAEDLGGAVDASADVDYAEVRGSALAMHGGALLDLIAEIALTPTFPAAEVERERRLITSQIQTRAETPFPLAMDTLLARLYGAHPYGLPALGGKATVERFGRDDLVAHYRRVYRADRMVLAVSGGVEPDALRRRAERLFATLPAGRLDDAAPPPAPPATAERTVLDRPVQQAQILMGFLAPGIGEADYAAGKVMSAILGSGMSSRLFVTLRDQRGLAYSLGMLNPSRRGPGYFAGYMGTAAETIDGAEAGMREEIQRFRSEGPSEAELGRAKAYVLGNLAMDRRTNARHAWYLAFFELVGAGWDYPARYARAVEAVTASDVARAAQRYLERPTTVIVRPRP
jgi:predicted Zn-dependent peptidase